jgi:hypothetical protein
VEQTTPVLDGAATLISGVRIASGLWHLTPDVITKFKREKAAASRGKFGVGTYFGLGDLGGETVDLLRTTARFTHKVGFEGAVLAVDRDQVKGVVAGLRTLRGEAPTRLSWNSQTGPLTDLADGVTFGDGVLVKAVLVYMDPERTSAELVVLPSATEHIRRKGTVIHPAAT